LPSKAAKGFFPGALESLDGGRDEMSSSPRRGCMTKDPLPSAPRGGLLARGSL